MRGHVGRTSNGRASGAVTVALAGCGSNVEPRNSRGGGEATLEEERGGTVLHTEEQQGVDEQHGAMVMPVQVGKRQLSSAEPRAQ